MVNLTFIIYIFLFLVSTKANLFKYLDLDNDGKLTQTDINNKAKEINIADLDLNWINQKFNSNDYPNSDL